MRWERIVASLPLNLNMIAETVAMNSVIFKLGSMTDHNLVRRHWIEHDAARLPRNRAVPIA
jgi:hypothetical protein